MAGITALDAAQFAMSAAQMALELQNAAELARISRETLREQRQARAAANAAETKRLQDEIARIEREIQERGGLGRGGAVRREDLDPAIVAVLGPEGERRPLELASLESALGLQFGVVGVSGPPTLEEIFVPSARGPPPKAAFVMNKLDWVLNKPGR